MYKEEIRRECMTYGHVLRQMDIQGRSFWSGFCALKPVIIYFFWGSFHPDFFVRVVHPILCDEMSPIKEWLYLDLASKCYATCFLELICSLRIED